MRDELIAIDAVCRRLCCCRASVYTWMRRAGFPQPIKVGVAAVRWRPREIDKWLRSRPRGGHTPA